MVNRVVDMDGLRGAVHDQNRGKVHVLVVGNEIYAPRHREVEILGIRLVQARIFTADFFPGQLREAG